MVFTDIEGSTALWDLHPATMRSALAEHDRRVRDAVESRGGYVFSTAGDSFSVAFSGALSALEAAIAVQRSMLEPASGLVLRVRIGLHSGAPEVRNGDYFGSPVNRCARVSAAAHGCQTILSEATTQLVAAELPTGVELVDLGIHRLRNLVEPERIHQVNHPDLPHTFPKLRSLEGPRDALPTQLTSFVGRDREIIEVQTLFDEHRLVTLSGTGGAGKTRLAIQVADEVADRFPDGVRFANLSAITDRDVLIDEIAQLFAVSPVSDQSILETIVETIRDRQVLLILDNAEQMVEHVAAVCREFLVACPNLHILATSRERLGVSGEVLYRVPSLKVPDIGVGVDEGLQCDAVRLFRDRARLAESSFEITVHNVDDVVGICQHLDGIPLAIELAAARVRSMSPAQITARLTQRFRLLTGGDRDGGHRQQTLLGAIEWSHDLLNEREQTLFRRVGSFASNFGLSTAEQVCCGDLVDEFDVFELITALLDKSMVATKPGRDGTTRYYLLETLREFALRQLDVAGETETLAERHGSHYANQAEELQAMQRRGELADALVLLDQDEDDFRSSLRYSMSTGEWTLAARIVSGLGYLWYAGGLHREGLQWCRELFDTQPELPDDVRAGALHSFGSLLSVSGFPDESIAVGYEQVTLRRRLGDSKRLMAALNNLGGVMSDIGEHVSAEPILREAIELADAGGHSKSLMLNNLGTGQEHRGEMAEAESLYREALQEAKTTEDAYATAAAMAGLGRVLVLSGQSKSARAHLVEARERFEELKVGPGIADVDFSLALVERADGRPKEAASCLLASLSAPGGYWFDATELWIFQVTASLLDDLPRAAVLLGSAITGYERISGAQPEFISADFQDAQRRLEAVLGPEELARHLRTGGRRTRSEARDLGLDALKEFIDH
jgi:predicted ATPase/class 3 adenylate cyclase